MIVDSCYFGGGGDGGAGCVCVWVCFPSFDFIDLRLFILCNFTVIVNLLILEFSF